MLDVTFPEEFEDLVRVRRKRKSGCGGSAVFPHNSFVVSHSDSVVFLDTVDEGLANPFHLVLDRQTEKGGESWILDVLLEEERSGSKAGREMAWSVPRP